MIAGISFQTCHIFLSTRVALVQKSVYRPSGHPKSVTLNRKQIALQVRPDLPAVLDRPIDHRRFLYLQRPALSAKQ